MPRNGMGGGAILLFAFLSEIAMLGTLVSAGLALVSSAVARVALAVLLPLAAAVVWGVWLAPASRRRLRGPALLTAKILLFCLTAIVAALSGQRMWAVAFAVTAIAVTVSAHRIDSRTHAR